MADARTRFMDELQRRRGIPREGTTVPTAGAARPARPATPGQLPAEVQARGQAEAQARVAERLGPELAAELAALSPEARRARIQEIRRERFGSAPGLGGGRERPAERPVRPAAPARPAAPVAHPQPTIQPQPALPAQPAVRPRPRTLREPEQLVPGRRRSLR